MTFIAPADTLGKISPKNRCLYAIRLEGGKSASFPPAALFAVPQHFRIAGAGGTQGGSFMQCIECIEC